MSDPAIPPSLPSASGLPGAGVPPADRPAESGDPAEPQSLSEALQRLLAEPRDPEAVVLDVTVATATMVITAADDPYRVLVGYSAKHQALVLPGGKLKPGELPLDGARRETLEEAGGELVGAVEIGVATDTQRDVRIVPFAALRDALTSPSLPLSLPDNVLVRARHGAPDHIFTGHMPQAGETKDQSVADRIYLDIRQFSPEDFAAGHGLVLLWYRHMLAAGHQRLPPHALRDFAAEQRLFAPGAS